MSFNMPKDKQFKEAVKLLKIMSKRIENKEMPSWISKLIDDNHTKNINNHSKLIKIFTSIEKFGKDLGLNLTDKDD